MAQSYKDLIVWQKAIDLVIEIYKLTKTFPKEEIYSLTSQIRRAAVSIPSNIAEGSTRKTTKDYVHFLYISYGSGSELETQLLIAKNLGFSLPESYSQVDSLLNEVLRMLNVIIKKLESND